MGKSSLLVQLLLSIWGFVSLYVFASQNGSLKYYNEVLETGILPTGHLIEPTSTGGKLPWLDSQHKQLLVFMWNIFGDGIALNTRWVGLYFCALWCQAWVLLMLESMRRGNKGLWITYLSVVGTIIFHQGHCVITPLYLLAHLIISPLVKYPTFSGLVIETSALKILPSSVFLGFAIPMVIMSMPASFLGGSQRKQTIIVWYQPWNVYITVAQNVISGFTQREKKPRPRITKDLEMQNALRGLQEVYKTIFLWGAMVHWTVVVSAILLSTRHGQDLRIREIYTNFQSQFSLSSPLSDAQASNLGEGVRWLLQWDGIIGTASVVLWAVVLFKNTAKYCSSKSNHHLKHWSLLQKVLVYTFYGGPLGAAVGLLNERDELAFLSSSPNFLEEPPLAAYKLPYLQHLPDFLRDPGKLFRTMKTRYHGTPFTLTMLNAKFHVFDSPKSVSSIFSRSREFDFTPIVASLMVNSLNLPVEDRHHFELSSSIQHGKEAFVEAQRTLNIKYLSGNHLNVSMEKYTQIFCNLLKDEFSEQKYQDWREVDFYELTSRLIIMSSVKTFFGPRLETFWPTMWKDWKLMSDASYKATRSNKFFYVQPRAFFARRRMLHAYEQWSSTASLEWKGQNQDWDEEWGCRISYERELLARTFGFTPRGRACVHSFFLFVMTKNVAAMVPWFICCVIQSRDLLEEYRKVLESCQIDDAPTEESSMPFNIAALKDNEFILGIWKESLRHGSAGVAGRVVANDVNVEGYLLRANSVVLLPSQLMHFDASVFPNPNEFNAERWFSKSGSEEERTRLKLQNSRLRSFGGGTGICSGRFVAQHETIVIASLMITMFDMKLTDGTGKIILDPRSFGIMVPRSKVKVMLRRREP